MIRPFDILDLLPQRPPFVMVDRLIYYDPIVARSEFTLRPDNIFCTADGHVEEAVLVEIIAQTCAARMGYREKTEPQRDGVVKIGFIGMIRPLHILRAPRIGETLTTTVEVKEDVFSTTLVETRVESGDETIATCSMKIYLTDRVPTTH